MPVATATKSMAGKPETTILDKLGDPSPRKILDARDDGPPNRREVIKREHTRESRLHAVEAEAAWDATLQRKPAEIEAREELIAKLSVAHEFYPGPRRDFVLQWTANIDRLAQELRQIVEEIQPYHAAERHNALAMGEFEHLKALRGRQGPTELALGHMRSARQELDDLVPETVARVRAGLNTTLAAMGPIPLDTLPTRIREAVESLRKQTADQRSSLAHAIATQKWAGLEKLGRKLIEAK